MKHIKTWIISLPLLWLSVGCSDEPVGGPGGDGAGKLHEVEITFNIGTRDGLHTRATNGIWDDCLFIPDGNLIPQSEPPRKLISSNNWQQVNDVRIYVFKENEKGKFVYYRPENKDGEKQDYFSVDAFSDKFKSSRYAVWWGGKGDLNEAHSYTVKPMLPAGKYHFLAVARDDKWLSDDEKSLTDPNTSDDVTGIEAWVEEGTVLEEATLMGTRNTEIKATELFSGCTAQPITVIESGGFQKEIALYRAEAGLMAYIENIPAQLEAWQAVNGGRQGKIEQGEFYGVYSIGVTNGHVLSDQVLLYGREALPGELEQKGQPVRKLQNSFLLSEDLREYKTTGSGNNITYINTSPDNEEHSNSLLLSGFIMPQKSNEIGTDEDDKDFEKLYKSLYLVFYTLDKPALGAIPLQWWPVKLVSSTPATGGTVVPDPYYFPIEANQFYSLGKRKFTGNGNELEEDEPVDLKKNNGEITITVHADWDNIGDFGLED